MKINIVEFDKAINTIKENIAKFAIELGKIDQNENKKIIDASSYFYENLLKIVLPLRDDLKNKISLSIDSKDYDDIESLIVCLKKIDSLLESVESYNVKK
jgi:molecular chaperone GrpE (heat shock protein)